MINPYFVDAMKRANKENIEAIIKAIANSENFSITDEQAISGLTLKFNDDYKISVSKYLQTPNVVESAKDYLADALKIKGINKTGSAYSLKIDEIPQLKGFSNKTLKDLGIDYKELASYLISANT